MSTRDSLTGGDSKAQPLSPNGASLNETLQTQHVNVDEDDTSVLANATRSIARIVGIILSPKQVLAILRVLKAMTLLFIVLTIVADLMYILFVKILASADVRSMAGGTRDTVIRLYGLALSCIALAVELDIPRVIKKCSGLKPFIARAALYYLIATITGSRPIVSQQSSKNSSSSSYSSNDDKNGNNDDRNKNDDGTSSGDDKYGNSKKYYLHDPSEDIPMSAVGFQMITSFILAICALAYLLCGLMCLDRFTAKAFLSTKDPRVTTALPSQESAEKPRITVTSSRETPDSFA